MAAMSERMQITLNGHRQEVPASITVGELVRRLGLDRQPCAAEVNGEVVPVHQRNQRVLHEGDVVELVTLVGGG